MRSALLGLLTIFATTTHAQLPDPPTEAQVRDLISRLHAESAGRTTPETRARLQEEIEACTGDANRLDNAAGVIVFVRGYPWEGMWFLTRAAERDLEQPDVLSNLGLVLTLVEETADAERLLLYAANEWPDFHPAWTNLARLYVDAEEHGNAQECLDQVNERCPGSATAEELGLRMSIQQRSSSRAAQHAANLSNIDPGNPMLAEVLPHIPDGDIAGAVAERLDRVPMPSTFVEFEDVIEGYEDFVLDEFNRGYWGVAVERFFSIGGATPYQNINSLPQEVWDQLPPDMQATMRAMGAGPGAPLQVLNPSASRMNYPRLAIYMRLRQESFLARMGPIYRESEVERLLQQQRDRIDEYNEEYKEALDAGADPLAAMNRWCRDVITSMDAAHPNFLAALGTALNTSNRLTREHWSVVAGLITMVPEAYQGDEISYLRRQTALNGLNYSGAVQKWYRLGMRAVILDRELTTIMAEGLHEAARARERAARIARERIQAEMEAELAAEEIDLSHIHPWIGLNAGIFSIKFEFEQVAVRVGEGVIGTAQYNWGSEEFEMGLGIGVAGPGLGPLGSSAKGLGVVRIGGDHGVALGLRENVQAAVASPVAGVDVDLSNEYLWLASAGRPSEAVFH